MKDNERLRNYAEHWKPRRHKNECNVESWMDLDTEKEHGKTFEVQIRFTFL